MQKRESGFIKSCLCLSQNPIRFSFSFPVFFLLFFNYSMHPNVHSSTIYNSQVLEGSYQVSSSRTVKGIQVAQPQLSPSLKEAMKLSCACGSDTDTELTMPLICFRLIWFKFSETTAHQGLVQVKTSMASVSVRAFGTGACLGHWPAYHCPARASDMNQRWHYRSIASTSNIWDHSWGLRAHVIVLSV